MKVLFKKDKVLSLTGRSYPIKGLTQDNKIIIIIIIINK